MTTAEQIAPLLKEAIEARIKVRDLVAQIELIVAGPEELECQRIAAEMAVEQFIDDWSDAECLDGFGPADAKGLLEELTGK